MGTSDDQGGDQPSLRRTSANCPTVDARKRVANGRFLPVSLSISENTWTAANECPPKSKKSSLNPNLLPTSYSLTPLFSIRFPVYGAKCLCFHTHSRFAPYFPQRSFVFNNIHASSRHFLKLLVRRGKGQAMTYWRFGKNRRGAAREVCTVMAEQPRIIS